MKVYLGDSVYADVQSGMLKLTTENGYGANNTIYLEDFVMESLIEFYKREFVTEHSVLDSEDREPH